MRRIRGFLMRLAGLTRKNRLDRELNEEIESHLELHVDDNLRTGMSPEEARRQAMLKLGGIGSLKESWRERATLPVVDALIQDLRYGVRMLRRFPGFSAVAVFSLGLGIGANTAIFTLIDRLLLMKLPVVKPERLYTWTWSTDRFQNQNGFTVAGFEDFRSRSHAFGDILCRRVVVTGLQAGDRTDQVTVELVSGNYFSMLGVRAHIGRLIVADDDRPYSGNRVAVVSHVFWRRYFGSDRTMPGRTIHLGGVPFVVVGVSEPRFNGLDPGFSPEVRVPLNPWLEGQAGWNDRARKTQMLVSMVGRLRVGVGVREAQSELAPIYRNSQEEMLGFFPGTPPEQRHRALTSRITVQSAARGLFGLGRQYEKSLPLLMLAVGVVMLIACVNVATLLLARGTARQREIAVRLSLGAARGRVLRQLFTESLMLATLGGVLGVQVWYWVTYQFTALVPPQGSWHVAVDLSPDWRVIGFLVGLTLLTSLIFGLMPAVLATRTELAPILKGTGLAADRRFGAGGFLVSMQVALSLTLLMSAGLLVRTLHNLRSVESGFRQGGLAMFSLNPGLSNYSPQQARLYYQQVMERVSPIAGIQSTSLDRFGLLGRSFGIAQMAMRVEGYEARGDEATNPLLAPHRFVVGPDYFRTAGIPLVLGREFSTRDNDTAPRVALVNEQFAKYYFGNENPIGRKIGWKQADVAIVGVVRNAKHYDLREQQLRAWYVPYTQAGDRETRMTLLVRFGGDPDELIPIVRQELQAIDRRVPVTAVKTVETQIDEKLSTERLLSYSLVAFGLLCAILAAVGLYGVMACSVARRTRDIGVHMAIGANRGQVIWAVLRDSLLMVALGLVMGVCGSLAVSGVTSKFLYGVRPADAATMATAVLVMCVVAVIAAWLPARRAARVDPMVALRFD